MGRELRITVRKLEEDSSSLSALRTFASVLARLARGLDSSKNTRLSVRHTEESKEKRA